MSGVPDDIPVEDADSMLEVVRNPEHLCDWLINLKAENLDKTRELSENGNHTVGENIRTGLHMRPFVDVLETLEQTPDPVEGEPPHGILRHPRAMSSISSWNSLTVGSFGTIRTVVSSPFGMATVANGANGSHSVRCGVPRQTTASPFSSIHLAMNV